MGQWDSSPITPSFSAQISSVLYFKDKQIVSLLEPLILVRDWHGQLTTDSPPLRFRRL
jgi:hypothetical protein